MNDTKLLGRWGEALAADFLRKKRYRVLGMGYRSRFGEIDVIAEDRDHIVFVEVKTRKNNAHGEAREFVSLEKQRRILATASLWLQSYEGDKQPRFDVIEVYAEDGTATVNPVVRHIENAFQEN